MRNLLAILLLSLLVSCNQDSDYTLSGSVPGAPDGLQVFISELNQDNNQTSVVDTLVVTEGTFEAALPGKEQPTISFLTLEGSRGNVLFIAEDHPVNIEVRKDSLFASKVSGGADNELLYDYLGEVIQTNKEVNALRGEMMASYREGDSIRLSELEDQQQAIIDRDKETKKKLVENNPNSIVSVLVLQDMMNSKVFENAEMRELFDQLSEEVKETHLAQTLNNSLSSASRLDVGKKAPDFSAPTPEGEELALKDALGKVTLVDFWASWCKPCRVENPNIVRVYEKYHDKGFEVLGVSLDRPGNRDKWLEAIEEDNLTWNQVSNLMFWQDPVAQLYNIQAIPAAFLLDENGVIIARDLRGDALEQKVAEVLGEN